MSKTRSEIYVGMCKSEHTQLGYIPIHIWWCKYDIFYNSNLAGVPRL